MHKTSVDIVRSTYLSHLEKELRLLPVASRETIVARVESYVSEVCFLSNCTPYEALPYLDDPRLLVIHFIEEEILRYSNASPTKLRLRLVHGYLTGTIEHIARPLCIVLAVILIVSGLSVVLLGLFNTGASLMAENQSGEIPLAGILKINPFLSLVFSLFVGALLIGGGVSIWKFIKRYAEKLQRILAPVFFEGHKEKDHAQKWTTKRSMTSTNAAEIERNEA